MIANLRFWKIFQIISAIFCSISMSKLWYYCYIWFLSLPFIKRFSWLLNCSNPRLTCSELITFILIYLNPSSFSFSFRFRHFFFWSWEIIYHLNIILILFINFSSFFLLFTSLDFLFLLLLLLSLNFPKNYSTIISTNR